MKFAKSPRDNGKQVTEENIWQYSFVYDILFVFLYKQTIPSSQIF